MMRKSVIIALMCLGISAKAQIVDTTQVKATDTTELAAPQLSRVVPLTDTTTLNASKMILQKRYRPTDEAASQGSIFSGTYLWGHGSYYHPFVQYYGHGPLAAAGVGKWFSSKNGTHRYHGVRVGAAAGYVYDFYDGARLKNLAAYASYLFDLGAYVNGYDPMRTVSVIPVLGLGYTITEGETNAMTARGLSLHMGAGLEFRLLPGVDLVVEPLLEFQRDPRKLVRQDIWRGYYPAFRGDVGLNYHLDRKYWRQYPDSYKNWQISLSGGPRVQLASLLFNPETVGDFSRMIGWDAAAGLSRKYNDWFYLRFQAGYAKDYWWYKTEDAQTGISFSHRTATHITGRMDAMFDVLGMLPLKEGRNRRILGLLLFAGPEAGFLHKEGVALLSDHQPYIGAQGGVQFRVMPFRSLAVYMEPRMGVIPYVTTANTRETKLDSYFDVYTTGSLGLAYTLGYFRRDTGDGMDYSAVEGSYGSLFRDLFVWGQGSFYAPLVGDYCYGPMAIAGIGKWFTDRDGRRRIHGVKFGVGGGFYFDRVNPNHLFAAMASASYLFDLSSYLYGFNPERLVSVVPLAGVGLNLEETRRGRFSGKALWAHMGADVNFQLLPGVELVAEPLFAMHQDPRKPVRDGKERMAYPAFHGNVGLNVHLGRKYWDQYPDPGRDWRVSLSAGPGYCLASQRGTCSLGWDMAAGLSRKYSNSFYLRLQGSYANKQKVASHMTVRGDAMLDLLSLGSSASGEDRRMGVLLFAGPEAGLIRRTDVPDMGRYHPYVGAQGGVQVKYEVWDGVSVYAEPRAGLVPYHSVSLSEARVYDSFTDVYGTLALGVECTLSQLRQLPGTEAVSEAAPKGGFFRDMYLWAQGSYYRPLVQDYGYGPMAFAGIGKWFSGGDGRQRYHGVRLGAGGGYFFDNKGTNHAKLFNAYASYLFDLSTYMHGFDPQRPYSVIPLVGVGVGKMERGRGDLRGISMSAYIGTQVNVPLYTGLELVAEPVLEAQLNTRYSASDRVYWAMRGNVGLNYHLDRKYWRQYGDPGEDWRVNLAAGPRWMIASPDGSGPMGKEVSAGVSRKYGNRFYLRLQGSYAKDAWWLQPANGADPRRMAATHLAGRIDAMYDLLGSGEDTRWTLLAFAGPEAGLFRKAAVSDLERYHPFVGAQTGVQLKYEVVDGLSLYAEPRMGIIPYQTASRTKAREYANYYDGYASLSFGIECVLSQFKQYASLAESSESAPSGGIFSDTYLWTQGAYYRPLVEEYGYGPMAFAGIGKWFSGRDGLHRYHGVRLGLGGGYFFDNKGTNHAKLFNAYASYLFDLSTYMHGFDPQRPYSVIPLVGVGVGKMERGRGDLSGLSVSAHVGTQLNVPLLPGVEVVAEPLLEVQKNARQSAPSRFYTAFRGNVGLNYHLDRKYWRQYGDPGEDWRVNLAAGPRWMIASPDGSGPMGKEVSAGVSRKYGNRFYLRLQGSYAKDAWWLQPANGADPRRMAATHLAGRIDAMYDLLGSGEDTRWALLAFAGPEAGLFRKAAVSDLERYHPFVGAQTGVQLKYEVVDGLSLYAEPRMGIIPYQTASRTKAREYANYSDVYTTVSFGIEYRLPWN